jgi:hypothetical protein
LIFCYLFNVNTSFSTGVDFATQLKATLQWNEGLTDKWNHLVNANISSIENDTENWLFRPPGAFLYYVPFLKLPLPLGESLRLAQLSLCIIVCFCWINITSFLNFSFIIQQLLGLLLALWVSNDLSYAGNVQLLVTAYSSLCTLFALHVLRNLKHYGILHPTNFLLLASLNFILGCIVFLKVSAIIYSSFILISLFLMLLSQNFKKSSTSLTFIFSFIIFCIPYYILRHINTTYGIELNEVYQQDYNNQWITQELWGEYFTETTKMPAVTLSLLASFSTFSPFNLSQTLLSNFLTYTGWFDNLILSLQLNPKVIYKSIVGAFFSILLILYFIKNCDHPKFLKYSFGISLFSPFFIFTYLANKHGYNYLITGTYNQQYIPLFCLIILWLTFNDWESQKKFSAIVVCILFFSVGMFTFSNLRNLGYSVKNGFINENIASNHIKHAFYGKKIKRVEDVIVENRSSYNVPIVYLGNSSTEELSIAFKGRYSGISNISYKLQKNEFILPEITEAIVLLDARLNSQELKSIYSLIPKRKTSFLLTLPETAKVLHIKG